MHHLGFNQYHSFQDNCNDRRAPASAGSAAQLLRAQATLPALVVPTSLRKCCACGRLLLNGEPTGAGRMPTPAGTFLDGPARPSLCLSPPDPLPRHTVVPLLSLQRYDGVSREGIGCGAGGMECESASTHGPITSGSEAHEGSDWFGIGHGGSRLGNAGRGIVTLVMCVSICGCEPYSLCKRHSPAGPPAKHRRCQQNLAEAEAGEASCEDNHVFRSGCQRAA